MARIVVSGYMVRHPLAGNVAAFLQYVVGLDRLGHEVSYIEEKGWTGSCFDPSTGTYGDSPAAGLRAVRGLVARHCPEVAVTFVDADAGTCDGLAYDELCERLRAADLLLDVGGLLWGDERLLARRRALVDMDPVFTQVGRFARRLDDYDALFSVGANIGRPGCSVPGDGHEWLPTVPPVVADLWAVGPPEAGAALTTVANWSAYGAVEHGGRRYGQKDREFDRLVDLPPLVDVPLELALSGAGAEVARRFTAHGWRVRDGGEVTRSLPAYRRYVAGSLGELSAAKHAYVATRSGWFSDRTVCYLAAGRPAIVQDTGIGDWMPTGEGVLTFSTRGEAVEAVRSVAGDPFRHARVARQLAAEVFDHRIVLTRLLEHALEPARSVA